MGSATVPLLLSSSSSLLSRSASIGSPRWSQHVLSTPDRYAGALCANIDNISRFSRRARCCSSSLSSYDVAGSCKRIYLKKHYFGSQQSVLKLPLLCTRTWKPSHVKSGEIEESSSGKEMVLDEQTLQRNLERAVEEENYILAAQLRDDLRHLQDDSKAAVLSANNQFYEAFKNGDFVAMRSIWMEGDNVCCIHPGAGAISGYDLVMGSWEIICGAEHEFPIMIDLRNVEVHVKGDVGYVTCLEVVKTKGSSWGRQVATNVFERVNGTWLMCIHHASHVDM